MKYIDIRVAVLVDSYGEWGASGWSGGVEKDWFENANIGLTSDTTTAQTQRYILTARLPIPEIKPEELAASVEQENIG